MQYTIGNERQPADDYPNGTLQPVHVGAEVNLDGTIISPVLKLDIHQRHGCHNSLEMLCYHDTVQKNGEGFLLDDAVALYGKVVEVIIRDRNDPDGGEFLEKFVVTNVELGRQYLAEGILIITALSPTHLLDGRPHYESFTNRTIADIVKQVCGPMERVKGWQKIDPYFTDTLPYTCRFNEGAWNFLKRLASTMGEWLFFDGTHLVFGKPGKGKASTLRYGINTYNVRLGMASVPLQSSLFGYDAASNTVMAKAANASDGGTESYAGQAAFKKNRYLFDAAAAVMPRSLQASVALGAIATASSTSAAAGMYNVSGNSTNFMLSVGSLADLSFHRFGRHASHGQLRITAVHHSLGSGGEYHNSFEAIPADAAPPTLQFTQPTTHPMLAKVLDNADPLGIGRVRVKFLGWQQDHEQETDWIRLLMPDAGSGSAGGNRGHVFVAEEGDQVLVDFIGNNPDDPIVTGAVFHGGNGIGGGAKNHLKTIATRSGCKIQFDDTDAKGSITVTDPSGNSWYMDGNGNISVNAPKNFSVVAGENVIINAGENVIVTAAINIAETAGENISHSAAINIAANAGENISKLAGKDYSVAATNVLHKATDSYKEEAKDMHRDAIEDVNISASKNIHHNSDKEIKNTSGAQSKNS